MNSIILLGRTTSDIELKQTQDGKSVATFSLAVKRPYTKDTTDFHTVVAWNKQAELLGKYVKKGNQICIRGYLTVRNWTDKQGNKRYSTEVIADEVSFVGNSDSSTEAKSEPDKANKSDYTPSAYTQPGMNFSSPHFEELKSDEPLPF